MFVKIFKFIKLLFCQPSLLNPNIIVENISYVNFKYLKEIGIKYLIFDKDNTLAQTHDLKF